MRRFKTNVQCCGSRSGVDQHDRDDTFAGIHEATASKAVQRSISLFLPIVAACSAGQPTIQPNEPAEQRSLQRESSGPPETCPTESSHSDKTTYHTPLIEKRSRTQVDNKVVVRIYIGVITALRNGGAV